MSGKTEFAKDFHAREWLIKNVPDTLPTFPLKDSKSKLRLITGMAVAVMKKWRLLKAACASASTTVIDLENDDGIRLDGDAF